MSEQQENNETPLCVVINPPDDIFEKAVRLGIDIDQVIIRFTKPRKIIARLPVQLLDGLEIIDDPQIVGEEFSEAVAHFSM
jgi:hypothetical protein